MIRNVGEFPPTEVDARGGRSYHLEEAAMAAQHGKITVMAKIVFGIATSHTPMLNTPATYSIYIAGLVFAWLKARGGIAAMERANIAKAALIYDYLDRTKFYRNPVQREDRSRMNVPFKLHDESLDEAFLKGAKERGMVQLKGHRAVGGMRASIYNAMPVEGVKLLRDFMLEFREKNQ